MKIKKIVITGGAGFLGQHLIERLNNSKKRDFSIIVIDKKKNPCPYINIHKYKNVIIHYDVDITDPVSIKDYFCEADIVYHLAGLVSFYRKDRKKLFKINVTGTENVLRACLDCKVKKVIHISSVAGIGYLDKEDIPADESLKFNWKAVPKKYYMLSKHLSEEKVKQYRGKGLDVLIINPGLMYGPGDYFNSIKLIRSIKNNKLSVIPPGGTNVVDVRDVAEGLAKLIRKIDLTGRYIFGGFNYTFKEITSIISKALKKKDFNPKILSPKSRFFLVSLIKAVEAISPFRLPVTSDLIDSGFKYRYFSSSKAEKETGFRIKIPFKKTITDTLLWYKKTGLLK